MVAFANGPKGYQIRSAGILSERIKSVPPRKRKSRDQAVEELKQLRSKSKARFQEALHAESARMRALAQETGLRQDATARERRGETLTAFQRLFDEGTK